ELQLKRTEKREEKEIDFTGVPPSTISVLLPDYQFYTTLEIEQGVTVAEVKEEVIARFTCGNVIPLSLHVEDLSTHSLCIRQPSSVNWHKEKKNFTTYNIAGKVTQ